MIQKRVTLKDIAKELNVSVTTISKAINKHPDISVARRKQIMSLLKERNYVPNYMAKNLRSAKTKFISLIVSDNSNPYYARVIKGVESVLSKHGYHTLIFNNNEDPEREINLISELLSINVAGVLITPAMGNSDSVKLLKAHGIPYVLLHRYLEKNKENYVVANDVEAAYIGTKYLIEKYGGRVGFINANLSISAAADRLEGYKKALREANISFNSNFVIEDVINQEEGYAAGALALERMGGSKFALLCFSDYIATGVMLRIQENNLRIPDDVAIMGIDGIELFSYTYPCLSSVRLPKFELGAKAAELLLEIVQREQNEEEEDESPKYEDTQIVFAPTLSIKGTA